MTGAASDALLDGFLGYHIKRASNVIQADLARTLKPFELRMITLSALAVIAGNPGLRQADLAAALEIERPNLVAVVDKLQRRGLIVRERDATDRRAHALSPTPAGRRLLAKALAAVHEHEARLFGDIDPNRIAGVADVMRSIRNAPRKPGQ
ncbi:MAG: MarR family transcriptional regulator [Rhodospirillaceae bacterium]